MCLVITQGAISLNIYLLVILEVPHLNFTRNYIINEVPMAARLKWSPQTDFLRKFHIITIIVHTKTISINLSLEFV